MTRILIAWLITTIAILLAAYLLPGIRIASAGAAIIGAAILGILNAFLEAHPGDSHVSPDNSYARTFLVGHQRPDVFVGRFSGQGF